MTCIVAEPLQGDCILHIGLDDTDSPSGMCTTYLAYKIAGIVKKEKAEFLDYPRLIRLNPNIPWKTRGNGAVSMKVRTKRPESVKDKIIGLVRRYSDTENGANPGLVFYENAKVSPALRQFSRTALWRLIRRRDARDFVAKNNLKTFYLGNGQGLIGAIGAVGYEFGDSTAELLSYRKKTMFGRQRHISAESVKKMQESTYPGTFNSYDARKNRILMAPRGPDPVFYGLRGEDPALLYHASKSIKFAEKLDGHMIFRSNQGTGDHLRNRIDVRELAPYTSGIVEGVVSAPPVTRMGGHVTFYVDSDGVGVCCAVYRPTGLSSIARELIAGDRVRIGGGVRRSTRRHPRTVNVELIKVLSLATKQVSSNPPCGKCGKNMKSKGQNQGFFCTQCRTHATKKVTKKVARDIGKRQYVPTASAHRHLTRPEQRAGRSNEIVFDGSIPWFVVY